MFACEFAVDNNHLSFLVTDSDKNLLLFAYQPESRESQGGQKLVRRGDFQLGQHVNCMFRIRAKITDPSTGGRVITGDKACFVHVCSCIVLFLRIEYAFVETVVDIRILTLCME